MPLNCKEEPINHENKETDIATNLYPIIGVHYELTNCREVAMFLYFLETNPVTKKFLDFDCCYRLADNYLIAITFIYFKRARLEPEELTYLNFFIALCLAHDIEEEDDFLCQEIYTWALGSEMMKELLPLFLEVKLHLWQAMDFRAVVSRHCCQQVFNVIPNHPIWRRERTPTHGGAPRNYVREQTPPSGPHPEYDNLTNTCAMCRKTSFKSFDRN